MHFDLVVIGAGPAGWSAALQGTKLGMTAAVVEKAVLLGRRLRSDRHASQQDPAPHGPRTRE